MIQFARSRLVTLRATESRSALLILMRQTGGPIHAFDPNHAEAVPRSSHSRSWARARSM
jgi:hypothetical protein